MESTENSYPELAEGEKILWAGKPEGVALLDGVMKTRTIIIWIVCCILILAGLYCAAFLLSGATLGQRIALLVVFDLIPVLILVNTVRDTRALQNRTQYHITNRRVLVRSPYTDYSLPLSAGLAAEIGRENRSVRLGKAVGMKPVRERNATLTNSCRNDEGKAEGVVLYNISDPDAVLRLIRANLS
ncbi:MAG: hypothetical protein K5746_06635 [Clostridiales bacterium]|nr:hypothetical protein [Clostridiales bacterium]